MSVFADVLVICICGWGQDDQNPRSSSGRTLHDDVTIVLVVVVQKVHCAVAGRCVLTVDAGH